MKSRYSLNLGKPFGIKVRVHWTFSLLIAWVVFIAIRQGMETNEILIYILFVLTLFVCVVLHEFGHSLTAIKLGGEVNSITLLPIGGIANITKMPEEPKHEFLVTAAGPAVNIVIALLLWLYIKFFKSFDITQMDFSSITFSNFPVMLLWVNLFIVAFNLIPAYPMDGGRLFRAGLSMKMDRLKATKIAKDIGQVFGIIFILAGLFMNPFLVIIGFFVLFGAKAEYEMMKYQGVLKNYKVKDVFRTDTEKLDENSSLGEAAEMLIHTSNRGIIITSGGEYSGLLTKSNLIKGLNLYGKEAELKKLTDDNLLIVSPEMSLFDAYKNMQKSRHEMVPVKEGDQFKGVLEMENINEFFMIQQALKE